MQQVDWRCIRGDNYAAVQVTHYQKLMTSLNAIHPAAP